MALIITFATSKGGTGKTTLAASLATHWHKKSFKVGVVDADPNSNLARWFSKGEIEDIPLVAEPDENGIIDAIDGLAGDNQIVLVDIAGFGNQSMVYAIGVSSMVLIPSRPSEDDVLEAVKTKRLVENASRLTKRSIPYFAVITQGRENTRVITHTRNQFEAFSVPVLKTEVMLRTPFQTARFHGSTPIIMEPNGKAAKEIADLANEIESNTTI
ncbi:ParA family protein [Acaryochloris marina]|uniref:ParA protein, putative n=1 Tax=Acaryochloris marina (strain MBIC 11017) TaxID=329726 RepID=A8ZP47_ACAM1|nr:ParA family protein [Acaryochloris marina]ABW32783.1 ParA protein, putative [Acaryochloris marina MBIC11017]